MPIFDFKCNTCNTTEERLVSYDEKNLQSCKDCDSLLNCCLSATKNFILKGDGFYKPSQ